MTPALPHCTKCDKVVDHYRLKLGAITSTHTYVCHGETVTAELPGGMVRFTESILQRSRG